jgi:hypothetical protein
MVPAVVEAAQRIAGQRSCGGRLSRQDHYHVPNHRSWWDFNQLKNGGKMVILAGLPDARQLVVVDE